MYKFLVCTHTNRNDCDSGIINPEVEFDCDTKVVLVVDGLQYYIVSVGRHHPFLNISRWPLNALLMASVDLCCTIHGRLEAVVSPGNNFEIISRHLSSDL